MDSHDWREDSIWEYESTARQNTRQREVNLDGRAVTKVLFQNILMNVTDRL